MKTIIILIVLAVVAWGGYSLLSRNGGEVMPPTNNNETENEVVNTPPPPASNPTVKEINVTGTNFAFSTSTINVNRGDTVRIVFTSQGIHDFVIDGFDARTRV